MFSVHIDLYTQKSRFSAMERRGLWYFWPLYCLAFLTGWVIVMGINPHSAFNFALENIVTTFWLAILLWSYKSFRLSNVSYTLITIFLTFHIIGAHYTYGETPLGFYLQDLFQTGRNHYDRIVHFLFGLLIAYPIREVFLRIAQTKGVWGYYLPLDVTLSFSAAYEILEWAAMLVVAPERGIAFLGMQGDVFDSMKDMACAGLGAILAMMLTILIDARINKNFWKEFKDSFRVKQKTPLGEVSIEKAYLNRSNRNNRF